MDPSAFRLQTISEIQKLLEHEMEEETGFSKKYARCIKIARIISNFVVVATIVVGGIVGLTLFLTVAAAPVIVIVESVTVGMAGLFSMVGSQVVQMMSVKADKHEKILLLAKAKLNTISDHISKALNDDTISAEEYSLITSEYDKFIKMKEELTTHFKKNEQ